MITFTLITIMSVSCSDQDPEIYDAKNGSLISFTNGTVGSFYVQDVPDPEYFIEVGVTTSSDVDRTFMLSVDLDNTTATNDQYSLDSATLFIPAGSFVGQIRILGDYANATTSGSVLVLKFDSFEEGVIAGFDNVYKLNIYQFCPFNVSDFLGSWNADEVDYQVYTSIFTAGVETDLNEIVMSNIWDSDPSSQTRVFFNDSDASNFKLDFPDYLDNFLYNDSTYGPAYIDKGTGSFSACAQTVHMTFQVRVADGFFSETEINFTKQ